MSVKKNITKKHDVKVELKNVTYVYDPKLPTKFTALKNVSAKFEQGEFVALIGHTGSGKTTFIEHLNGLLIPSRGEVHINDRVITSKMKKLKKSKEIRSKVGVVFQFAEYQLFEETVQKDIIYGPMIMGVSKEEALERSKKCIDLVGLDRKFLEVSPFDLSGGQKRRVAIAGILAMEPDYLVLDEPTAGLDPEGEKEMYALLKKLCKENNTTIIVATHNMDHVLEHAKRAIVFYKGTIKYDGNAVELMYDKKLMDESGLDQPQLASLVRDVEKKGKYIGKPTTITQFVNYLTTKNKGVLWK